MGASLSLCVPCGFIPCLVNLHPIMSSHFPCLVCTEPPLRVHDLRGGGGRAEGRAGRGARARLRRRGTCRYNHTHRKSHSLRVWPSPHGILLLSHLGRCVSRRPSPRSPFPPVAPRVAAAAAGGDMEAEGDGAGMGEEQGTEAGEESMEAGEEGAGIMMTTAMEVRTVERSLAGVLEGKKRFKPV